MSTANLNEELETEVDDLDDGSLEVTKVETTTKKETSDELKAAMATLAGTVTELAKPKAPPEPELTQDQKDELWAVYNPEKGRKDFMQKFFRMNPEATVEEVTEAKELFADMQKGLVKQAVVSSRNLFQIELQKRDDQIKELLDYVSQDRAGKTRDRFFSQYEGLKDKKYSKIINITARELADKTFPDEESYFKALAEGAAETISGVEPTFVLGAGKTKQPAGTSPRLPRTSVGGTGGTGGGKQAALSVKGDATDDFLEDA